MMTSIDCEKLLVATCLQGRDATKLVAETNCVEEEDFGDRDLQLLFASCLSLFVQKKEVNALEVQQFLRSGVSDNHFLGRQTKQEKIECLITLTEDIAKDFPFLKHLTDPFTACNFVKNEARKRKIVETLHKLHSKTLNTNEVECTLEAGIAELMALQKSIINNKNFVSMTEAIAETKKQIADEKAGKVIRFSTGFPGIDSMLKGIEMGALYVLSAEEKIGKSLFAGQVTLNLAKNGIPVGIISMEMKESQIIRRFSGASNWISLEEQQKAVEKFEHECSEVPLFIRSGSATGNKILSSAREMVSKKKIQLLIVDYLQLVDVKGIKDEIRVNEINTFVSALKGLAQDLNIGIILISAVLNKQIGQRGNRKPTPSDLRDSGRIANDCDVLLFLWKPEEDTEPNYLELFVSRGREGEQGKCGLFLNSQTLKLVETTVRGEVPLKMYKPKKPFSL